MAQIDSHETETLGHREERKGPRAGVIANGLKESQAARETQAPWQVISSVLLMPVFPDF